MNSALLLVPLFLIRYGLLSVINKKSLSKAAFFTPMIGLEKTMYLIYEVFTILIVIYMFFLKVNTETDLFSVGLFIYIAGVLLFALSTFSFAKYSDLGVSKGGMYRFSRNPMYVSYFIYFLGCVLITNSMILFIMLLFFQVSAHWIILSEERWCIGEFGIEYSEYMKKVRRYV